MSRITPLWLVLVWSGAGEELEVGDENGEEEKKGNDGEREEGGRWGQTNGAKVKEGRRDGR